MSKWTLYCRLLRFNKPAGLLLLWCPTAWALWVANKGCPPLRLLFLFALGTLFMRSAGCVVNDIIDRRVDKQVARTQNRPLAAGELSVRDAFLVLLALLFASLLIVVNLPMSCCYLALVAVLITFLYPWCKRFIKAPQMVLGLAFSIGIPMAYAASGVGFDAQFLLLCSINFLWIIAYDTMYAMADREDDLRIGLRSTALYFAQYDRLVVGLLLSCLHALWLYWGLVVQAGFSFYGFWLMAGLILLQQLKYIHQRLPAQCYKAFFISIYYGLCLWLGLILEISPI